MPIIREYALRALRSPCTWVVLLALYTYGRWARAQYLNLAVGACDLGIFHQAVQGWAYHGWPDVPIKGFAQLGDHFSPAFALLAPALWVYDSPIVLVYAQVLLICLSGIPIYLVFRRRHDRYVATAMLVAYLAGHAVLGTVKFPVHEVMFGALFLAWGLERLLAERWTQATVLFALLVTVKEDMGIVCALLGLYLLWHRRWRHAAFLTVWGVGWFVLALKVIIPALNPNGFSYAKDYQQSLHADGIFAGLPYLLTHPVQIMQLMVDDPAKVTTWTALLLPIGFVALASPLVLLVAPMMLARMLSSRDTQWSSILYYDMPLMPIMFAAAADGIRRIGGLLDRRPPARGRAEDGQPPARGDDDRPARRITPSRVLATVAATVILGFALVGAYHDAIVRWHLGTEDFNRGPLATAARQALTHVPPGVTVRATNNLLVPLLPTNTVTLIGSNVDHGDWAVVDTQDPSCPIGPEAVPRVMGQLDRMGFRSVYTDGRFAVLRRTGPAVQPVRGTGLAS